MRSNNGMRLFIFSSILFGTFTACSDGGESANANFSDRGLPTAAVSNSEAEKGAASILKQYFPRYSNDPDLRYTLNGQYLYELRDVETEIKADEGTPDLANGVVWVGKLTLRPGVFKKIDVINCLSTRNEEGTTLPVGTLTLIGKQVSGTNKKEPAWECPDCKDYFAPERGRVERWLIQCDKPN